MGSIGLVEQPFEIIIENGYIKFIEETKDRLRLKKYLKSNV